MAKIIARESTLNWLPKENLLNRDKRLNKEYLNFLKGNSDKLFRLKSGEIVAIFTNANKNKVFKKVDDFVTSLGFDPKYSEVKQSQIAPRGSSFNAVSTISCFYQDGFSEPYAFGGEITTELSVTITYIKYVVVLISSPIRTDI